MNSELYKEIEGVYREALGVSSSPNRLGAFRVIVKEYGLRVDQAKALIDCWESRLSWEEVPEDVSRNFRFNKRNQQD